MNLRCNCGNELPDSDIEFGGESCNDEGESYYVATVYCEKCNISHEISDWGEYEDIDHVKEEFVYKTYLTLG